MRKALLLLVVLAGFLAGCKEEYKELDPESMGYSYYPLSIGDSRIYQVTNIRFKNNVGDTSKFQMRELVDSSYYDQTNTLTYKIVRSIRPNENATWVDDSVIVVSRSVTSLLQTQDNTKYVKLVFPVKNGKTWEADAFNSHYINGDQKEPYTYAQVGEAYQLNGQTFPNTVTVIQGNPQNNIINLDERREVYAKGVGRVYRIFNKAVYCNETAGGNNCPFGEEYKLEGHERHEVLISYTVK